MECGEWSGISSSGPIGPDFAGIKRRSPSNSAPYGTNRLLDGFEGKLTSSKWAKIEKCSADTALRDINELVAHGILARDEAGGRSTSYSLAEIKADR